MNIYTIQLEKTGSRVSTSAISKPSLKNYQNNYLVFMDKMKLL